MLNIPLLAFGSYTHWHVGPADGGMAFWNAGNLEEIHSKVLTMSHERRSINSSRLIKPDEHWDGDSIEEAGGYACKEKEMSA